MEPTKKYKTYQFKNAIEWQTARRGTMAAPEHPPINVGSPPEFKGTADVWCPEEMLVGAVNACIMLTFLAYAQNRRLEVSAYESHAEGTLEHSDGKYRVTRISLQPIVHLKTSEQTTLAEQIFKSAKEDCFISNSVTASVDLSPQFTAET